MVVSREPLVSGYNSERTYNGPTRKNIVISSQTRNLVISQLDYSCAREMSLPFLIRPTAHAQYALMCIFVEILPRILAQSCVTPPYIFRQGLRMIVLVSLIVLPRRLLVPTVFRMVHPYTSIHSVE